MLGHYTSGASGTACDDDGDCAPDGHCRSSLGLCSDGEYGTGCDDDHDCDSDGWCSESRCIARYRVLRLTIGSDHTCVLLERGVVKCWGHNSSGELGLGDSRSRGGDPYDMGIHLPAVELGTGRTAIDVSAGFRHTCALLDDHTLKCWGSNARGELGQGDTANRGDGASEMGDHLAPVNLGIGRTVTAVAAGTGMSCALLDDGAVKCWGFNHVGQLGLGDTCHDPQALAAKVGKA